MSTLTQDDLHTLTQFDTPTVCNGMELIAPERRALGFTTQHMVCVAPGLTPIVGYARTATIRAAQPSDSSAEKARAQRVAYYEYVATGGPLPSVTVIQDLDAQPGFGAFWGEVNSNIHKGLGSLGCVTNGSVRDLPDLADDFQIIAGNVGPSHAHVHVVDFACQINIFGMTVSDGDIIHADQHGAVVVPASAVKELPDAIAQVARREKVILDACKTAGFDITALKKAMAESAEIH